MKMLDKKTIEYVKEHKELITKEILDELRKTKEGKHIALEILDLPKDEEQYYLDAFGNRISNNGNRMIKKPFTKINLASIHIDEIKRCFESLDYFKNNYVQIKTPKTGVNFPDLRPYQDKFLEVLNSDKESIVSLQGRQSGKSISTSIYLTWLFLFRVNLTIGICANKGKLAAEFLNNVKNIFLSIPIWMQQGITIWNKGSIENENGTRILTDVPSSDSFRGFTCDVVVVDECAFIPASKYDAFADSVYPSQSSKAWKKNILLSTANGLNHFYQIVKKAKEPKKPDLHITKEKLDKIPKESIKSVTEENNLYNVEYNTSSNGFTLYEVDWKDVPRYDKDGNVLDPETFKQQVIDKYGEVYFNQNYANSFIGSSYTLINAESLSKFTSMDPILKKDNMLDVFKEPQKKHSYILSVDTAKDGQDFFSVHVVDITKFPFEQVASCNIQTDYFLMPEYLDDWGKWYNNAYMIIENNDGSGQSVADMMKNDYEYENLHYDTVFDAVKRRNIKKKYPGFRNTPRTRKLVLDTLKLFIENGNLIVNDFHTIDQFYTFILVNGKYQADDGCHDDLVMALAISFAPFCNTKNFSEMKTIIKNFYDNSKQSNEDFSSNMIYGRFDDFSDSSLDNSDNFSCFES